MAPVDTTKNKDDSTIHKEQNGAVGLPKITVDTNEMEDIRWFSKDYVKERLSGGSTARDFVPNRSEEEFHIPGKSSLARLLITQWTEEDEEE